MSHAENKVTQQDGTSPALCSGGVVGGAPSVAELEQKCRTIFLMSLNADPRNKWENDFYKRELSAAQAELKTAKRTANTSPEAPPTGGSHGENPGSSPGCR